MTNIKLVRVTNANRQKFYDLFVLQPFDSAARECTWLKSKNAINEQNNKIRDFLETEKANLLKASTDGALYAYGNNPPVPLAPKDKSDANYPDFVRQLRKIISIEVMDDKSLYVTMDPLPVGEEIAILYQMDETTHWEVATAKTIEKSIYIDQLLAPYSNVTGLPMQLGITEFADGTKILNRFYAGIVNNKPSIGAATLHRIDPSGVAHTVLTNEDFIDQFIPSEEWLGLQEKKFGPATAFHRVTSSQQCKAFVDGEGQFSISKTSMKTADGTPIWDTRQKPIIGGRFLQHGSDDKPVIQDPNASILEELMYILARRHPPARPAPLQSPESGNIPTNRAFGRWVGRNVQHVSKVTHNGNEAVKADLGNNAYILEQGQQLSLHGSAEEQYLKTMILYARDHWGGQLQIDQASDAVREKLRELARNNGVTIVESSPVRPPRPDATTRPPPLAA